MNILRTIAFGILMLPYMVIGSIVIFVITPAGFIYFLGLLISAFFGWDDQKINTISLMLGSVFLVPGFYFLLYAHKSRIDDFVKVPRIRLALSFLTTCCITYAFCLYKYQLVFQEGFTPATSKILDFIFFSIDMASQSISFDFTDHFGLHISEITRNQKDIFLAIYTYIIKIAFGYIVVDSIFYTIFEKLENRKT
jgi:hypothetical protein